MNLSQFIYSIKGEYLLYLYENYKSIFPGCCHEASNLLCGYLNYYFDESFKHKFVSDVPRPHSYISNENGIIIDFTSWQYMNYYYGNLNNEDAQRLLEKAERCQCFPIVTNGSIYISNYISEKKLMSLCNVKDVECFCTDEIDKYPPELFMQYCTKDRAKSIQKELHKNNIL
ncbi:hypothetical protein [Kineothrix sedimenti]|uniref:Uncharacterized protein n=1 Tax=Kineothrix sedimenti TaxID=3123317 RepID=A0ABZ3F184_9FIRM